MANQVAARLAGDDYQHLTAWLHVLELKRARRKVLSVAVEDSAAGSADDVTVRHEADSAFPDSFYQIKYHVDQRSSYSTAVLTKSLDGGTSLLQKLYATWQKLSAESPRPFVIRFVSNWSWDSASELGGSFSGLNNAVKDDFFTSGPLSKLGKERESWSAHLEAAEGEFEAFVRTLHFDLGSTCFHERLERVRDLMETNGLRSDDAGLLIAVGLVRGWVRGGTQTIDAAALDRAIEENDLQAPADAERFVTVLLTTVKAQRIDLKPDHIIDWRDRFEGLANERGHATLPGVDWNRDLLPELAAVEAQVAEETGCRLVRIRGLSRLSAWFGIGRTFSENARYVVEVDQRGLLWRSDAPPSESFDLQTSHESGFGGPIDVVAVGISVTSPIGDAVRDYLQRTNEASELMLLQPNRPLGHECLGSAADVVALARKAKEAIREFSAQTKAKRVLLFYLGPLSGACFLGHVLNAMGTRVQVMEYQDSHELGYAPAFLL